MKDVACSPVLEPGQWQAREANHRARFADIVAGRRDRQSRREKHPIEDFLFEYYRFRPAALEKWTPGIGVWMEDADDFLQRAHFTSDPATGAVGLPAAGVPEKRRAGARWICDLLKRTAARRPMFGCSGLHEWAMIYERDDIRHGQLPLRIDHEALREVVETQPVRCSHFDAFRFFSASAKDFNLMQPSAETRGEFEQPGCLHANMDLYKWAFKLDPWIPGELVGDCFELALETREIDMRASPYDVSSMGYEAIPIETAEGRAEYARLQRVITERSAPLRSRLIEAIERMV